MNRSPHGASRRSLGLMLSCLVSLSPACDLFPTSDEGETGASGETEETGETGETGSAASCGWNPTERWYACGYEGEDPLTGFPRDCVGNYAEGGWCPDELLAGCCTPEGGLWYCEENAAGQVVTAFSSCDDEG